jgi:hypothetical protein
MLNTSKSVLIGTMFLSRRQRPRDALSSWLTYWYGLPQGSRIPSAPTSCSEAGNSRLSVS